MHFRPARLAASTAGLRRVGRSAGLAAALVIVGCNSLQNAVATGETRSISLRHTHRADDLVITFKRNGAYDDEALKKLNWFLRDWRTDDQIKMDPHLFDILWEVNREVDAKEPIHVVSSYRSPKTNEMLRRRGRGVARHSQHMLGRAIDFYIPGASLELLRNAGLRLQRGGVGFYPTSGSPFIHVDTGNVRHWPRLSRDQLARVFPDGRTVHVPSDGQPLAGYALASADLEKRGMAGSAVVTADAGKRSLFARLFGFGKNVKDDEDEAEVTGSAKRQPAAPSARQVAALDARQPADTKPAEAKTAETKSNGGERPLAVPLPAARPTQAIAVASARRPAEGPASRVAAAPNAEAAPRVTVAALAGTPNAIVASRGLWHTDPKAYRDEPVRSRSDIAASFAMFGTDPAKDEDRPALAYAAGHSGADRITVISSSEVQGATVASLVPASLGNIFKQRVAPLIAPRKAHAATSDEPRAGTRLPTGSSVWTRAIIMAPSLTHHLTATSTSLPDVAALQPLLQKPASVLLMTFSAESSVSTTAGYFDGEAPSFQQSVSFRTAEIAR